MLSLKLLGLLGLSTLSLLPLARLAAGGGPACEQARAARPEVQFDQEIFFAVLEGLYRDGVTSEVVEAVIARDPESGYPQSFVQGCPICMPALDAFQLYLARPPFASRKLEADTFGPGLAQADNALLASADLKVRRAALQAHVERWMQAHMQRLRLDEREREHWNLTLAYLAKQGMSTLSQFKQSGLAIYADFETCPLCQGVSDAASQ